MNWRWENIDHSAISSFIANMWTKSFFIITVCVGCIAGAALQFPVCEVSKRPYMIEDKEFCDKYYICQNGTATAEELCDDGLVFDTKKEKCDLPHAVECGSRTKLQPPRPTANCPRRNGMYPVVGGCDQFYHCTDGQHTLIRCPPGIIFEPSVGACVHPDQTNRPNCSATQVLHFVCPNIGSGPNPSVLRFGDHDRLAHPTSCRHFYMCLLTGMPRLGGCTYGLVFNPVSGRCDEPKNVAGCEKWYGDEDVVGEDDVSEVSPSLVTKRINNSAARLLATTLPARTESQQSVNLNPMQTSRRLLTGNNRFGRIQAESIDSVETDA